MYKNSKVPPEIKSFLVIPLGMYTGTFLICLIVVSIIGVLLLICSADNSIFMLDIPLLLLLFLIKLLFMKNISLLLKLKFVELLLLKIIFNVYFAILIVFTLIEILFSSSEKIYI